MLAKNKISYTYYSLIDNTAVDVTAIRVSIRHLVKFT